MAKRFHAKKEKSGLKFLLRIAMILCMIYLSFAFTFRFLWNKLIRPNMNEETFLSYLIHNSLHYEDETYESYDDYLHFNLKNPSFLLRYSLNHFVGESQAVVDTDEEPKNPVEYVPDPSPSEVSKPLVYIYNTHQTEGYDSSSLENYNIKPSVLMASYVFKENLNDLGVPTIVETNNVAEILRTQNWAYSYSYQASRILLEDAYKKNPSLQFFIDLHRDSSLRDATTTEKDGKSYAKVLFIVGKGHKDYEKNLALANYLNDELKKINPDLSRGVTAKGLLNVSGIYNQDFSKNAVLIELGGQYNSIEEATNTIPILSKIIANYVKEKL